MIFKILGDKDFKIKSKKSKLKPKKMVPTQKVTVTDCDTGEVTDGCDMNITKPAYTDTTPFVKLFRPNLFDQLKLTELRLFCYIMEKMNVYNIVSIQTTDPELYEYTGFTFREQVYSAIRGLKDMSVIESRVHVGGSGRWRINSDCIQKIENTKNDRDRRLFVKIYEPRRLMELSSLALSVFSYLCVKMDYEGCIKMNVKDFRELTGYKKFRFNEGRGKYTRSGSQFYKGKKELIEKDFIRDITTMVDDSSKMIRGQWYRVNPNIFIKGSRIDLGYGVE